MASGSNVYVGSDVLTDLQNNLRSLSDSLENLFQTMVEQMNSVSSFWQDAKYEEFKAGYSGHIAKCHDIANNYNSWATGVLQNTINRVVEVEKTDVSGSSISGGAAASAVGATNVGAGISGAASSTGIAGGGNLGNGFNLDGKKMAGSKSSSEVVSGIDTFLNKPKSKSNKLLSQADIECQNKFGSGYHGVPSSKDQAHVSLGGNTPSNNKISSEVEVNLGILKGKLGSEASDGSVSSEGWAQCVQD